MDSRYWRDHFEQAAELLRQQPEPAWGDATPLPGQLVASLQRFQAGENGDGTTLIRAAAAAGDEDYTAAVRMFVAEEQRHARLLARILAGAGAPLLDRHWSDTVFVMIRHTLGLRLELMALSVAEAVALRHYGALHESAPCPLLREVAGRILDDERRHVPFHQDRLRQGLGGLPRPARAVVAAAWWLLMAGALTVVVADHRAALDLLGVSSRRFVVDVARLFRPVVRGVCGPTDRVEVPAR